MLDSYTNFKYQRESQILKKTDYLIKSEIFPLLPGLNESEIKFRKNMLKNLQYKVNRKDRLRDYYEEIRKKYTQNNALAHLSNS